MGTRGGHIFSRVVQVVARVDQPRLAIYPQPVGGNTVGVRLSGAEAGFYILRVTDMSGRQLVLKDITLSAHSGELQLDISSLPPGAYSLSIFNEAGIVIFTDQLIRR
jgi:hypothetical protein